MNSVHFYIIAAGPLKSLIASFQSPLETHLGQLYYSNNQLPAMNVIYFLTI